jgi:lipid II:glycine glycyltransferase (peptidoglycan interpeptide bridge formation enzyme)
MHIDICRDRDAWNTFIESCPYGHVLQSWEWGEVKERSGQTALRLAVVDGGEIQAAAQIFVRPFAPGLGQVAYLPKGPVLDYEDVDLLDEVIAALQPVAREQRVISLKIEPEVTEPGCVASHFLRWGLEPAPPVQMRSTIWVDLESSEEDILARQKQKTRYNIRLAERRGVEVSTGCLQDLEEWYAMYAVTARRDGFSIHSRDYYRSVLEALQPDGMARLLLARHEGDLLAGIIVFAFGHRAQYMYGASSDLKRNLMAPYLVQWRGMQWARERGCRVYDLWGIPDRLDESEELWGVYRHKRGYGGKVVRYIGAFDLVQAPLRQWALENLARPLFKRVARLGV